MSLTRLFTLIGIVRVIEMIALDRLRGSPWIR